MWGRIWRWLAVGASMLACLAGGAYVLWRMVHGRVTGTDYFILAGAAGAPAAIAHWVMRQWSDSRSTARYTRIAIPSDNRPENLVQLEHLPSGAIDQETLERWLSVLEGIDWSAPSVEEIDRSVNTFVALPGETERVIVLTPGTEYELLLNIGWRHLASLVEQAEARWPAELFPDKGVWLRAALLLEGQQEAVSVPFYLPAQGESWVCSCEPGLPHVETCSPHPWVRLPVRTLDHPGIIRGELLVYYEAAAVIAMQVELPAGSPVAFPRVSVVNKLSRSFTDLGKLSKRAASVVLMPQGERVVVNGASFLDSPFAIGANAADTSAANIRTALFDSHFRRVGHGRRWPRRRQSRLQSLYDAEFAKSHTEYEQDLRRLALEGQDLYVKLFAPPGTDTTMASALPDLLRHEARMRGRPPVLQIVDDQATEYPMLWPAIYDLAVSDKASLHESCPSVRKFGPEGDHVGPVPPVCPFEDQHSDDVLCPYGFWGLSSLIEQPPPSGRDLRTVVHEGQDHVTLLAAMGASLNQQLTTAHVERLRDGPPACRLERPPISTERELVTALGPEDMDVVYFYCHCGYERRSELAAVDRYLDFGDYSIKPIDVKRWARGRAWEDPHWSRRSPLVVLNGCHTTEVNSGTLNDFVGAFTQWAGASGVVGTEVIVEQGLAGWVMEQLLTHLLTGASVASALRSTRWAMLHRGNVMGLAYTAHCLANLTLRPPTTNKE
ncbi:CHAT domain-containing protein [Streptomyces sp. MBT62]|uniref:CHAT domain-containing protein n=1 Tax=Streptomyces sp. MBT62 TaxID=2800410 RepID=UPI001F23D697|nr:CHAT domain-containing protein [Streptomyces sp. MBT62]